MGAAPPAAHVAETARVYRLHPRRVPLGRVVATPGALDFVGRHGVDLLGLLLRHETGDWGDVCADDARANDRTLDAGARVLSAYETPGGRVWIITEADRSATTVLLPSEY